ncbi:MAG: hypothetical protein IPL88_04665 [Rhizobiales bacterium]|nr:hypothetical protein [Hyphomicrobiales bacterium]
MSRARAAGDAVQGAAERSPFSFAALRRAGVAAVLALTMAGAGRAEPAPAGDSAVADLGDLSFEVFIFRPTRCAPTGLLVVFHGLGRDAAAYRDAAVPLAEAHCLMVAAPLFDAARFPAWRYQRGGLARGGRVLPQAVWTVGFASRIADWARAREGRPDWPVAYLGHSAGAQYLSRVAAFAAPPARRIAIADPSSWVSPSLETEAPYGFGGALPPAEAEAALRRYLALPIVLLAGAKDTGARNLSRAPEAERQGANRLERARTIFAEGQAAAQARGVPFGWRLVVVPGVAHSARRNFATPETRAALAP